MRQPLFVFALFAVVTFGMLASYIVGVEDGERNKLCPAPEVRTETLILETACDPCQEVRAEEGYIWIYKDGVPLGFYTREYLINQLSK